MLLHKKQSGKRFLPQNCIFTCLTDVVPVKGFFYREQSCARQRFNSVILRICIRSFYRKRKGIFHKCSRISASFCKTAHSKLFCSAKKIAYLECFQLAKSEAGNFSYTSLCLYELQIDRHSAMQHAALFHHQPNCTSLLTCAPVTCPDLRSTPKQLGFQQRRRVG